VTVPSLPVVRDFTVEGWTRQLNGNNTLYGAASRMRLIVRPGPPATTTGGYAGVWLGGIDEVAVYGSALSGATIAAHVAVATAQAASASGSTPR
jgi:hypothetical protein